MVALNDVVFGKKLQGLAQVCCEDFAANDLAFGRKRSANRSVIVA
jgi:hypothetical protein